MSPPGPRVHLLLLCPRLAPGQEGACQALPLGGLGGLRFLPASGAHCLASRCDPALHICQALCHLSSLPPLLSSVLGCEGEIAIVKGPLVKIKITLVDSAIALHPHGQPGGARGCARVAAQGRVGAARLGSKPQPCLFLAVLLSPLCLSLRVCLTGTITSSTPQD